MLTINDGDTDIITATTVPSGGIVRWSSTNEAVAIVNDGVVTAVSPGSCRIIATSTINGITHSSECVVIVI